MIRYLITTRDAIDPLDGLYRRGVQVLQFLDGDKWKDVPIVMDKPEEPAKELGSKQP